MARLLFGNVLVSFMMFGILFFWLEEPKKVERVMEDPVATVEEVPSQLKIIKDEKIIEEEKQEIEYKNPLAEIKEELNQKMEMETTESEDLETEQVLNLTLRCKDSVIDRYDAGLIVGAVEISIFKSKKWQDLDPRSVANSANYTFLENGSNTRVNFMGEEILENGEKSLKFMCNFDLSERHKQEEEAKLNSEES